MVRGIGTGKVAALTPQRGNRGQDLGDLADWQLSNGMLWFNPATSAVQYVLRPPKRAVGVEAVVPCGRPMS